ncbi:hypothetical protein OG948_58815 (plasmid) [Embleya sp. NBC_00888]|uniref:hypothetical protein n=1 Tax=Embleya sp. NBC_00888 TaxID=2975960 RepID=UPI00386E5853|nr:hypothetical protein OG948_58815 [Embleya sp. NBC_00888]
MRTHTVRRLPVIRDDRPVAFISLGDLAEECDPHTALADIRLRQTLEPATAGATADRTAPPGARVGV